MAGFLHFEGPPAMRWAAVGAASAGVVGGVVGLVIGLIVHWQTAWFAIFELGVPAAFLGGLVGLVGGAAVGALGSIKGAPNRPQ